MAGQTAVGGARHGHDGGLMSGGAHGRVAAAGLEGRETRLRFDQGRGRGFRWVGVANFEVEDSR